MGDTATMLTAAMTVVAVGLEIICVVCGGLWAVSRIQMTTTKLTTEISHLANAISDLKTNVNAVQEEITEIKQQVIVLETKLQ